MIRRIPACSGSVTITAHRSSRWNRWTRSVYGSAEAAFPSSQSRGGAKRRGGQFGETFRRSDHPVCAFGASTPPLRGGECAAGLLALLFVAVFSVALFAQTLPFEPTHESGASVTCAS